MKKFWLSPRGLWSKLNQIKLENWIYLPLMFFFYLVVVVLLLFDLMIFIYKLSQWQQHHWLNKIKTQTWPHFIKTILTFGLNWSSSLALIVLIIFLLIFLPYYQQNNLSAGQSLDFLPTFFKPEIIEEILSPPEDLKIASTEALIKLEKKEMERVVIQAQKATDEEKQDLTQKEKLNIALAHYYLGDQNGYRQWLEQSKAMDPNERFFP